MSAVVHKIVSIFTEVFLERREYFRNAAPEIAMWNMRLLLAGSVAETSLLVILIILTPYIIRGWEVTPYHIWFVPISLLCLLIITLCSRWENRSQSLVTVLCVLFEIIVLGFIILIDTAGTPDGPGTFFPMLIVVMPAVFTFPFYISYGVVCLAEVVYIAAIIVLKDEFIGQYDIFASLVGLLCSIIVTNLIVFLRVSDYKTKMKYVELSTRDSLTDILNKQTCLDTIKRYFQIYNPRVTCSLAIVDLDNFKTVNDLKGHAAGDLVLQQTGQILLETFRRTDVVGRFGGDEFLVLVKGAASQEMIKNKCRIIQRELRSISDQTAGITVTASIGIVLAKDQQVDFDMIFSQADTALYEVKHKGKADASIELYRGKK